jgi:hypothetical protein
MPELRSRTVTHGRNMAGAVRDVNAVERAVAAAARSGELVS